MRKTQFTKLILSIGFHEEAATILKDLRDEDGYIAKSS
jgi:hypothetical protein